MVEEEPASQPSIVDTTIPNTSRLVRYVSRYLDTVHLIHDEGKRARLQAKLLSAIIDGVKNIDDTYKVIGMRDPQFSQHSVHEEAMIRYVRGWLKQHRFVFTGCEDETAATVVDLAKQALGLTPIRLDIFEKLQDMHDEAQQDDLSAKLKATPKPSQPKRSKRMINLNAIPDDEPVQEHVSTLPVASNEETLPVQLAMF